MAGKRNRRKTEKSRRAKATSSTTRSTQRAHELVIQRAARQARIIAEKELTKENDTVAGMASEVLGSALRVIQDSPQYGQFDCKAGCAFCCHTAITVATPEAVAVSDFVRRHFDDDATAKLRERLTSNADLAANVSRDEYIAKRVPCAMLSEDANCLVHPVRPLACAGFLSTSASRCEDTYVGKPGADPSPGDRHAMAAGLGTSFGLKQACRDSGRDGEFYELHHAVLRLLDAPDAGRRWLDGESVLQGCMT